MSKDFLGYKFKFMTTILILGYTFMHLNLTGQYPDATLEKLMNFSARLPFGQRLLIPAIAHFLSLFLPLAANNLFFIIELAINGLFYYVLFKLLCQEFSRSQARLLSWLFFLLLPLITVVNYRFTIGSQATYYYPYDSASLLFITAGFFFCLRSRWLYFIPLVFVATLNRESSLLLLLMLPALHWQKLRSIIQSTLLATFAYILARMIILFWVQNLPGTFVEFYFKYPTYTHFAANLIWLFNEEQIILFLFCFAGLPLFWFVFYDYIPLQYRPLRYVTLFYFLCLLLFGNLMEARLYLEIVVLMYLPVCAAIRRWLLELGPFIPSQFGIFYYVDRYFVLGILLIIASMRSVLNPIVIWLANHFN
ncbi:Uncharacterised protein [Legionella lansingensis]|uniref:Uncharacterized protein n=1 Tax=Legionella lansingensis TaxID=45067 RepID=A0A0W0VEY2_9GAMM|nr:hypothetical protein [Legionella lansingensis]KTD18688.1 hypothetical protein Llan_2291 [Legionella lansingensis]SNV57319.1 Uncharacterised protein [Legionella lansingensis]